MILKKIYDESTRTQKVWYDSSMMFYSEMIEDENENVGDLYVTFKNGSCYKYNKVKFEDYVLLLAGGTDASQGKTLNKVIKNKYEFEKMPDSNMELLTEELNKKDEVVRDKNKTYFISGHRDLTDEEFEFNYIPAINLALHNTPDAYFVIGDCRGADIMAQNYLIDVIGIDPDRITVYYPFEAPRKINPKITNTVFGFTDYTSRDAAMTEASFEDIAFVRDSKQLSGTGENILRRYLLK